VAQFRVAELSPDAPAFDYCVAVRGTEADGGFIGPVLQGWGAPNGLEFPSVGDYMTLAPDSYDLRFVQPSSLSCYPPGGPLVADVTNLPALAAGQSYTLGIMGSFAHPTLLTMTDNTWADGGNVGVRLIHSAQSFPAAIDMTANGKIEFSGIPYATVPTGGGLIDQNGYTTLFPPDAGFDAPLTYSLNFAVHGSSNNVLVVPCVTFTAGSVNSVFAIPSPGGYSGPIAALVCYDSLPPQSGLTLCTAMPVPGSVCQ
jgi:hypothetical protein